MANVRRKLPESILDAALAVGRVHRRLHGSAWRAAELELCWALAHVACLWVPPDFVPDVVQRALEATWMRRRLDTLHLAGMSLPSATCRGIAGVVLARSLAHEHVHLVSTLVRLGKREAADLHLRRALDLLRLARRAL